MITRRLFAALAFAAAFGAAVSASAAASDAAAFIADLGNKALTILNQRQKSQADYERQFHELLHEGFDVSRISCFVLGRYCRTAPEAQRQEFAKAFEDYIVGVYTVRFSEYTGESFKVTGSRAESEKTTLVSSQIVRTGGAPPVKVDWRVSDTPQGPKITDVTVEGVSMILTQRDEFASILQRSNGDLQALINLLKQKTKKPA
jgi:phospholipid transport system substrate-binding protein